MQFCHFFFTIALVINGFKLISLFSLKDDRDADFLPSESDVSEDDQSDRDNDISASESEDESEQAKLTTIVQSILDSPTLNNGGIDSNKIDINANKSEDKNEQPKLPTIEEPIIDSPTLNKFGSGSYQTDETVLLYKQRVINQDTDDEFETADVDSDTTKNKNDVIGSKLGKHES